MISLAVAASRLALAQQPPTTTLTIDLDNLVEYQDRIYDPAKFAGNANITPSAGFANFGVVTLLGDIVAVKGQPAIAGGTGAFLAARGQVEWTGTAGPAASIAEESP